MMVCIVTPFGVFTASAGAIPNLSDMPTNSANWDSSDYDSSNQFGDVHGIATDSKGNVYAVDNSYNRVEKFTPSGTYITQWGTAGSGNGQFSNPDGIATDTSDNVYVVDRGNNRIQKFTASGTYITQWGALGSGDGQFNSPRGIVADSKGNIYVADATNHRVQKFTASGSYVSQWTLPGTDAEPDSITINSVDTIYVSDMANNQILKYKTDGTPTGSWSTLDTAGTNPEITPLGIVAGCYGDVYINQEVSTGWVEVSPGSYTINVNYQFQKYSPDGTYQGEIGMGGYFGAGVISVLGLAIGNSCQIYNASPNGGEISVFTYPAPATTKTTLASAPIKGKSQPSAITISTPARTDITCSSVSKVDASAPDSYHYPLGLVEYCFSTGNAFNTVTITFVTDLKPGDVTPRKYNPLTKKYATITDAKVTETKVDGKHALKLVYVVYDNGPLDTDPAIGSITDPVGLGTQDTNTTKAPDTGISIIQSRNDTALPLLAALAIITIATIRKLTNNRSRR